MKTKKNTASHFRFFRVRAETVDKGEVVRGTGHLCVGIRKVSDASFRVGFSFKSPADELDVERGVEIAAGRLTSKKTQRNFIVRAKSIDEAVDSAVANLFTKTRTVRRRGASVERALAPDWLLVAVSKKRKLVESKTLRTDTDTTTT